MFRHLLHGLEVELRVEQRQLHLLAHRGHVSLAEQKLGRAAPAIAALGVRQFQHVVCGLTNRAQDGTAPDRERSAGGTWRAASVQDRIIEWAEATPMSDKGKEQWARVPFNVSHNILGCDVVFGDGTTARLGRQDVNKKIFQQIRTGQKADMGQMLTFLLQKTNTRKQSLITPAALAEAFEKGVSVGKPHLKLSFPPGACALLSSGAKKDVRHIVFDVEFTLRPKESS